jgi:hypothetical protein
VIPWKARLAWLALALLIVGGTELAAGFWPAPRERLEAILEIFELHPTRIWALRKGLDTRFMGAPLHTDHEGWRIDPAAPGAEASAYQAFMDNLRRAMETMEQQCAT